MTAGTAPPFVWQAAWFDNCSDVGMTPWRGVESQSQIATWPLVDTAAEHEALEQMIEDSKPPLPEGCDGLHYLLFTPFRYTSHYPSRFRRANEAGIWYGADSIQTVCAELAYWRNRFILDSSGLVKDADGLLTRHTLFQAHLGGQALDLTTSPWDAGCDHWTHGADYGPTQAVAADARVHGVGWIRYESVRNPGMYCAAVLSPKAFAAPKPSNEQEWVCNATRSRVIVSRRSDSTNFSWEF